MYQLRKKILPILLPSIVEAENFSDHPRTAVQTLRLAGSPFGLASGRTAALGLKHGI